MKHYNQAKRYASVTFETVKRNGAYVATGLAASPLVAVAQESQPDTSAGIAYIAAGVATVLAIFVPKYGVKAAMLIGRWAGSVIGR